MRNFISSRLQISNKPKSCNQSSMAQGSLNEATILSKSSSIVASVAGPSENELRSLKQSYIVTPAFCYVILRRLFPELSSHTRPKHLLMGCTILEVIRNWSVKCRRRRVYGKHLENNVGTSLVQFLILVWWVKKTWSSYHSGVLNSFKRSSEKIHFINQPMEED